MEQCPRGDAQRNRHAWFSPLRSFTRACAAPLEVARAQKGVRAAYRQRKKVTAEWAKRRFRLKCGPATVRKHIFKKIGFELAKMP